MKNKMVDYSSCDHPYKSVRKQGEAYSPGIVDKLRRMRKEIRSCKVENDRLVEVQEILSMAKEKQVEPNLNRNAKNYKNIHKYRDAVEIILHFINVKS